MAAQDYYGSSGQNPYPPPQPTYAPQQYSYGDVDPSKVRELVAMGFTDAQASQALRETGGDVARAVDWLFKHPNEQPQQHLAPPPAYSRPTSAHSDYDAYQAPSSTLPPRPTSTGPSYADKQDGQTGTVGPDGEQDKGLFASVAGGAGGAFLGNKLMHGTMGKIMGGAAGAVVANVLESKFKNSHHNSNQHSSGGGLLGGLLGGGSHGSNQGGYGGGYGSPGPYQQGGYMPPPQPQYSPGLPPPGAYGGGYGYGQPGFDQGGHHGGHHGHHGGHGRHGSHGGHGHHSHHGHHGHGSGGW